MVQAGKLKGMSTLLTALVEPILQGGLSVESAVRSVRRLQRRLEDKGTKLNVDWSSLLETARDLFAPPPMIPDDLDNQDLSQLEQDLEALLADVRNQKNKQPLEIR
jgi:3-methyladenine DNA glycosylase AlkC